MWTVIVKHPDFALKTHHSVRIIKEKTANLSMVLEKGTAVYVRLKEGNQQELFIEFSDPDGRVLNQLSSLMDVMDKFFGDSNEKDKGLFLGRYSPGAYYLKTNHPQKGAKTEVVRIVSEEDERVLTIEF